MKTTLLSTFFLVFFTATAFSQGTIVEDTVILHLTVEDINQMLDDQGLPPGILPVYFEVDVHRIVYETPHPSGFQTAASGLVFIPTNDTCAMPMMSYLHGTKVRKDDTFYYLNGEWNLGAISAASGYAVCLPDYIGLGLSPGLHPYQHGSSEASAAVDLMRVCRTIMEDEGRQLNGQNFIVGYSQGGHATMYTHKYIQEELQGEFTVTASAPGSGPYDMSGAQLDMVAAWEPYSQPGYLPYVLMSYQMVYGDLFTEYSEIFASPYDTVLPPMFNGEFSMGELNAVMPDTPRLIIQPDYADVFFSDTTHPAFVALKANDVYNWVPEAPVMFNYCGADEEVTPLNTSIAVNRMNALGALDVTSVERSETMTHFECAQPSILFSKFWFDSMADLCSNGVGIVGAQESSSGIYPNPVVDRVNFQSSISGNIFLVNTAGQVVFQQQVRDETSIDLSELPSGMYMLRVIQEGEFSTFRLIKD